MVTFREKPMKSFLQFSKESKKPIVEKKPWMENKHFELVTQDTITRVVDECIASGLYGFDLETTGLNTTLFEGRTKDRIVGFCLSPDGEKGYYAPVRHIGEGAKHNIPLSKIEPEIRRLANSDAVAAFHNGKFDQEFLQFNGGEPMGEWDNPKQWEDTLILAYLRDSRAKRKGLKYLSATELQAEMIELHQLYPADHPASQGYNFAELDPGWAPVIWYAGSDAICTYNLFKVLHPQVVAPKVGHSQKIVYDIEKMCCAATRWMERCRVHIKQEKVRELIQLGQKELFDSIKSVYDFCLEHLGRDVAPAWWHVLAEGVKYIDENGNQTKESIPPIFDPMNIDMDIRLQIEEAKKVVDHNNKQATWVQSVALKRIADLENKTIEKELSNGEVHEFPVQYDVMSATQLGPLMVEMEIPDIRRTEKSKQVMTTAAEMDRLTELHGDTFPFMARIKRFREVQKALSTYLLPLRLQKDGGDADDQTSTIKIEYNAWKVDTGRFNTPGSKQPHLDGGTSYPMHGTPATYDQKRPECLRRVRETIAARKGKMMAALDFSGVELRIVTNLSKEPKWVPEFFRCSECSKTFEQGDGTYTPEAPPAFCPRCGSDKIGDLHTKSAIAFYGEDSQNDAKSFKLLRNKAKGVNFALCYGGSGKAVCRTINCDDNEGWRIYKQFTETYKGLQNWWKKQHEFARKYGYVLTAFGRKYPVPDILLPKYEKDKFGQRKDNGAFIAKAERNAVNGPIQATSADITKLAMALIYKECKKRGWLHKVLMIITIHDELVFEIDLDILEEALEVFQNIMARNSPLMKLKWAIPLTLDTELGFDWTVPWNLKDFVYDKKEWPEDLKPYFPQAIAATLAKNGGNSEEGSETPAENPTENSPIQEMGLPAITPKIPVETNSAPPSSKVATSPATEGIPNLKPGEVYVHHLRGSLRQGTVEKLAQVLHICRDRGSHPIEIRSSDGEQVIWKSTSFTINPIQFSILAEEKGV